jgi:hypothetical protein
MNNLMRMMMLGSTRRPSLKQVAMMGAAGWAMNRMTRRSPVARRGVRAMNTASWALPLGMMAVNHIRSRRGAGAGGSY